MKRMRLMQKKWRLCNRILKDETDRRIEKDETDIERQTNRDRKTETKCARQTDNAFIHQLIMSIIIIVLYICFIGDNIDLLLKHFPLSTLFPGFTLA